MEEAFLGEIMLWAGNYAPRGWMLCNGQLLQITKYTGLFALLGTTYGGDGRTTLALPDLRGRVPVGQGAAMGLVFSAGMQSGSETYTLTQNNLPSHMHDINPGSTAYISASISPPSSANPIPHYLTVTPGTNTYAGDANATMPPLAVDGDSDTTGAGQPISSLQPSLVLNYCICVQGVFPPR